MKNNLTEMVFILDRSGSMSGLENDTIGGFNAMIAKQKKEEGAAFVTTVLFDTRHEILHDRLPLDKVPVMTDKDYCVGGGTALLDAVGAAIKQIEMIHKYARPEDVPEHTIFIITTDWEFLFLGANIDAAAEAARIGISRDRAADYQATECGTQCLFEAVHKSVAAVRRKGTLADNWKDALK